MYCLAKFQVPPPQIERKEPSVTCKTRANAIWRFEINKKCGIYWIYRSRCKRHPVRFFLPTIPVMIQFNTYQESALLLVGLHSGYSFSHYIIDSIQPLQLIKILQRFHCLPLSYKVTIPRIQKIKQEYEIIDGSTRRVKSFTNQTLLIATLFASFRSH